MKKFLIIFLLLIMTASYAMSEDPINIREFSDTMKGFNNEFLDDYDYEDIIRNIEKGDFKFDYKKIFGRAGKFFIKETR